MVETIKKEKKRLGAFYTDPQVVRFLVRWGLSVSGGSVMDPSCGDGRFLVMAGEEGASRVIGCDVDPTAVRHTRESLANLEIHREVIESDFFQIEPASMPAVDLMVGNPPFIRYQLFKGETRRRALASALRVGVKLTRLAASWAPFLLHALQFLKEGGTMAMVVPAEMVQTNYGIPTLHAITRKFAQVQLLTFEHNIFSSAQEETFLLLAAGYGGCNRTIEVISLKDANDLALHFLRSPAGTSQATRRQGEARRGEANGTQIEVPPQGPFAFQKTFLTDSELKAYEECAALLHPLGKLGTVSNGYVSGANQFFHRTYQEAIAQGLCLSWLRPAARASKSLRGLSFTTLDISELEATGFAHHLVMPEGALFTSSGKHSSNRESLNRFIAEGEKLGIDQRFKCRTRTPWWRVPRLRVPDLLVPYMISKRPRISVNLAKAVYTNTLHGIRLRNGLSPRLVALAMVSSVTLLSMELEGRSYGGGVLKLEPTELQRVLIPLPNLPLDRISELFTKADSLIRTNQYDEAVTEVDRALLMDAFGYNERTIRLLRSARERLLRRRLERTRKTK